MQAGYVYHRLKSENVSNYQILTLLQGLRSICNMYMGKVRFWKFTSPFH